MIDHPTDYDIPTYEGKEARDSLFALWGIPCTDPIEGESHFGRCRVLYRDDYDNGRPVAYWMPERRTGK